MNEFMPLNSHQIGIKIKKRIIENIDKHDTIILDFENVEFCTDSFIQQLTLILEEDIGLKKFKEKIKFKNLNNFIKDLVKGKLYIMFK
jgi:hypothetical protein